MDSQQLRVELHRICIRTYATQAIFERREMLYTRRVRFVGFIGMVIPAVIGLIALGYGAANPLPSWIFLLSTLLLAAQFCFSLWSTFMRWEEGIGYSAHSQQANLNLFHEARIALQIEEEEALPDKVSTLLKQESDFDAH